ncbi:MAG: Uma2 family endonuclease [Polyangiales bacterium]
MIAGEPVWALATRFPPQGRWGEEEYLAFEAEHPRIELVDGFLDVLPLGTNRHQAALEALLLLLKAYGRPTRGVARVAGGRLRLRPGVIREPDVMYLRGDRREHIGEQYWTHADLVIEVVSPGATNEVRDRVTKRREYADAKIPEYWIVDPDAQSIAVLALGADGYEERAVLARGDTLTAATLPGLSVRVAEVFDAD